LVGRATAGGYGWRLGKSLAIGFLRPEYVAAGTEVDIDILGRMYKATVVEESPYDPQNERLRS
jgi:dimethylglycine dehydrogenase